MNNGFRVGVRVKSVAFRFEIGAQLLVVINLAIEHHPHALIFIMNRLMARVEVNDRESPHTQAHRRCALRMAPGAGFEAQG